MILIRSKRVAVLVLALIAAACGGDDGAIAASTTTRSGVPNAVDVISAGPSAGSGEVGLRWNAVANATGYRVLRATTSSGPFVVNADFDVTTGKATAGTDVINIWSEHYSYKPTRGAFVPPDASPRFEYIEIVSGGTVRRYFRVVAYNTSGDAPASIVVCGVPINQPAC